MFTLFRIFLLFTASYWYGECKIPTLDPSKVSFTDGDIDRVCFRSYYSLRSLFYSFNMQDQFIDDGIALKPAEVPKDSPCNGMPSTCCLQSEEKVMLPVMEFDYHQKLESVLRTRTASCVKLGRNTERALFNVMKEAKTIFLTEISKAWGQEIPSVVFDDFFQFLFKFTHKLDFCQLTIKVKDQMRTLYKHITSNNPLQGQNICADIVKEHIIETWYNGSVNNLVETFNNIRLLSESFQMTKNLLNSTKQHKFNQACIDALYRLRYCAYCIGNQYQLPICDGLCINTFRGCMVDMYDLLPHIKLLEKRLQKIISILHAQLMPIHFVESSLIDFIQLVRHVKKLSAEMIDEDNCTVNDNKVIYQLEIDRSLHNVGQYSNNVNYMIKEDIKKDMLCYKDIQATLSELDEYICDVDPKQIKYIRNKSCWNGTHNKASYQHVLVGKTRIDQMENPAFRLPISSGLGPYKRHISQIETIIHEINQTSDFYECIKADDEDCSLFVLQCSAPGRNNTDEHVHNEIGSGSGSGSGSGYGVIMEDLSKTNHILIHLGNPRRYDFPYSREQQFKIEPNITEIVSTNTFSSTSQSQLYDTSSDVTLLHNAISNIYQMTSAITKIHESTKLNTVQQSSDIISLTVPSTPNINLQIHENSSCSLCISIVALYSLVIIHYLSTSFIL